jgi:hypothetical protein
MPVKLTLQKLSDWVTDSAKATKGAADLALASGLLRESLDELCDLGGVAGALFKLGSRVIPDPTPEQRIAAKLHTAFLKALDRELEERSALIGKQTWKEYRRTRLGEVASSTLSGEFTWLSIFGSRGRKPGRSWPIVGELADLGRTWVLEAAIIEQGGSTPDLQRTADDVRGRLHDALAAEVDRLVLDPVIASAVAEAQPGTLREALVLLAQELTTLRRYRLFGEIPQEAVYIPARIKLYDLRDAKEDLVWSKVEPAPAGEESLFAAVSAGHPRLVVLEGEMGVGKSCLMRVLAAYLADRYLSDRRLAPIFCRWRDLYEQQDLPRAVADQLGAEYGLPLHELPEQADLVYLVDGFDEMNSHQEVYVRECFERLAKLVQRGCSVVVSMRSTMITPGLRLTWKNRVALAAEVQPFLNTEVDAWADRWRIETQAEGVTGARLRSLCQESGEWVGVANNPLLLYMLAKYVEPVARGEEKGLTRTEVFRIFVDETIRGKLRTSREDLPIQFDVRAYRMLLQEIAYLASWPKHAPKCPVRLVREKIAESILKELNFQDIRTAFVLHFFEPGDASASEFEFQPEGFRQYLLAEWCARAQIEALLEDDTPPPLSRTRSEAMNVLAQFPLMKDEMKFLNEIYEDLGRLAREKETTPARLQGLGGLLAGSSFLPGLIPRLYQRVRREAEAPPAQSWRDERVGLRLRYQIPSGLEQLRLLTNYWEHCLVATFGLYRGLGKAPESEQIFEHDPMALHRFSCIQNAFRPVNTWMDLNLSRLGLAGIQLAGADLCGTNLEGANLQNANLIGAWLSSAMLEGADLRAAKLNGAFLVGADLRETLLEGADLREAVIARVDLRGAIGEGRILSPAFGRPAVLPDGSAPPQVGADDATPSQTVAKDLARAAETGHEPLG